VKLEGKLKKSKVAIIGVRKRVSFPARRKTQRSSYQTGRRGFVRGEKGEEEKERGGEISTLWSGVRGTSGLVDVIFERRIREGAVAKAGSGDSFPDVVGRAAREKGQKKE